ncbi:hypothetical protein [Nostoc sp.]|uniref:hypothetical protein n=1 Tax=Nostoc sp. TaxID=1180 RepID=UPI002FFB56E8
MAELPYMQALKSDACSGLRLRISKPSAHLMGTSFQPFAFSQITTYSVRICPFAQLNLKIKYGKAFTSQRLQLPKILLGIETANALSHDRLAMVLNNHL